MADTEVERVGVPAPAFAATLVLANMLSGLIGHKFPRWGCNFGASTVGQAALIQVLSFFFLYSTESVAVALVCQLQGAGARRRREAAVGHPYARRLGATAGALARRLLIPCERLQEGEIY